MNDRKIFVLDTNVILHDNECIYSFGSNDIIIPISVIEELDNFKSGKEQVNYNAREFIRTLDSLSEDTIFNGGVKINGDGTISIYIDNGELHPNIQQNFEKNVDNKILNCAYKFYTLNKDQRQVILISKDANLRIKAKSLGINAQDYKSDKVHDTSISYKGYQLIENFNKQTINDIYKEGYCDIETVLNDHPEFNAKIINENEYFVFRNGSESSSVLVKYESEKFNHIEKPMAYEIRPKNSEQTFALDALLNDEVKLVTITGKAGTGKTLLALAAALEKKRNYKQIFLARPIVPLSNKDMGFLPGSIEEKLDPYMQPLYDNLSFIKDQFKETSQRFKAIGEMLENKKLVISPLAYIRGRSLNNIYFIIDEAQNLTPHEIKTIITRAGEGAKFVFTGDVNQIDSPYLDKYSNGLSYMIDRMKGQPLYAHINLENCERSILADLAAELL